MASRIGKGNAALWSVLLYNMAEAEAFNKYEDVFINLCRLECLSGHDVVNMVRCCVGKLDLMSLQDMLTCIRNSGAFIDTYTLNRSLAVCSNTSTASNLAEELVSSGVCTDGLDAVGYNTLMKCNARSGKLARCFELRDEMMAKGVELSEITYGTLLDACVSAKEMESARKVFDDLCQSNRRVNVVHCTTFLKGLVASGKLDEAATVLGQMSQSAGVKPDLITYSTVVRAFAENGNISSAMKMLEQMIQEGVQPDEIIFNSVLSACSAFPLKSTDVLRAFDLLLVHGMVPTTTTLSILVKALMLTEAHTLALRILTDSSVRFNLEPAMRLYVQLIQACIKARKSKAAMEVFHAMLKTASSRSEVMEPGDLSRLIRSCIVGGNHQLANEFRLAAQNAGLAVEPHTERMLNAAKIKTFKPV
jgi:pentatricopeptide repeat protein